MTTTTMAERLKKLEEKLAPELLANEERLELVEFVGKLKKKLAAARA